MYSNEWYYGIVFAGMVFYGCMIIVSFTRRAGPLIEGKRHLDEAIDTLHSKIKHDQQELTEKQPQLEALVEQLVELRAIRDKLQEQSFSMEKKAEEEDELKPEPPTRKKVDR